MRHSEISRTDVVAVAVLPPSCQVTVRAENGPGQFACRRCPSFLCTYHEQP